MKRDGWISKKDYAQNDAKIPPHELMRMYRTRLRYSQEKLADLINKECENAMIYQMRISRFESGKETPEPPYNEIINKILGMKIWS